jgi:hypothetical protein
LISVTSSALTKVTLTNSSSMLGNTIIISLVLFILCYFYVFLII